MEALALQSEDLSKKERRRKENRSQRHEHCLAGRRSLRPARRSSRFFSNFELFFGCVPPAIFASKLSVQLLRGTESTSRYVDRSGYQQTKNNLCSKMPPTANLRIFLHKPIAGSLTWTAFPRGWVPLVPLEAFLEKNKKVRSKKSDWACWSKNLTTTLPLQEKNLPAHTKWSALKKKKVINRRLYMCHSISAYESQFFAGEGASLVIRFEDGSMVYLANAFDSHLRGD